MKNKEIQDVLPHEEESPKRSEHLKFVPICEWDFSSPEMEYARKSKDTVHALLQSHQISS